MSSVFVFVHVWERSPEKKRLHFHGLFYIPDGTMAGELQEVNDFSLISHKRQVTVQKYFNEKFGRSDFEKIEDNRKTGAAVAYIMKYMEKSGERIVYSRGLSNGRQYNGDEDDYKRKIGFIAHA